MSKLNIFISKKIFISGFYVFYMKGFNKENIVYLRKICFVKKIENKLFRYLIKAYNYNNKKFLK